MLLIVFIVTGCQWQGHEQGSALEEFTYQVSLDFLTIFRGGTPTDYGLPVEVQAVLDEFVKKLKARPDTELNLSALLKEKSEARPAVPVCESTDGLDADSGDPATPDDLGAVEEVESPNVIKLSEVNFDIEGTAYLIVRGNVLELDVEDYTLPYASVLKDPRYLFIYDKTIVSDSGLIRHIFISRVDRTKRLIFTWVVTQDEIQSVSVKIERGF